MQAKEKFNLIRKEKSIALVSPSIKGCFYWPALQNALKKIGFDRIFDLSEGLKKYNRDLAEFIKSHPEQKIFITSACPKAALLVCKNFPKLAKYLLPIDSPMAAAAKIYKEKYPDYKIFFISPCLAKEKIEAIRYKEIIEGVIVIEEFATNVSLRGALIAIGTTKQSRNIAEKNIQRENGSSSSGLLAPSSSLGLRRSRVAPRNDDHFLLLSARGPKNISKTLKSLKPSSNSRVFIEILRCESGCKPNIDSLN